MAYGDDHAHSARLHMEWYQERLR